MRGTVFAHRRPAHTFRKRNRNLRTAHRNTFQPYDVQELELSRFDGRNRKHFQPLEKHLGKPELIKIAEKCFKEFSADGAKVIIDPVFGDNGKLYPGFDLSYVEEMKKLLKHADVILPNVTEACFLTDTEYKPDYDIGFIAELEKKLARITGGKIIITGALLGEDIAEVIYGKESEILTHERIPQSKHGTGDIFASVFTANYLQGKSAHDSCETAAEFVAKCLKTTDSDHFYGVNFERVLKLNN